MRAILAAILATATAVAPSASAKAIAVARQGVIYTGGEVQGDAVAGQMQTFFQIPAKVGRRHYPIIFIHGSRLTGAGFLGTPDGRPGWASWFLGRGWPVYIVDQPGKGRSGYFPSAYGAQDRDPSRKQIAERFTASAKMDPLPWPEARLHTQWPGTGLPGDPIFEQFFASEVANMPDVDMQYALTLKAVTELLAKTGPAIIVTHSQAGPLSWMIAEANPGRVKAIIAIEPTGNASRNAKGAATRCGITNSCLNFAPAITDPSELDLVRTDRPEGRGTPCWLQRKPRHKLTALSGIAILIATGEASYHSGQDYCTSAFLSQAGVANEYAYLPEHGIHGNGHMQMLEKNNLEIAAFYEKWLLLRLR